MFKIDFVTLQKKNDILTFHLCPLPYQTWQLHNQYFECILKRVIYFINGYCKVKILVYVTKVMGM